VKFKDTSIRTKIIFPYILLTLVVGMAGAYIVTRLVFDSVEERLNNQLIAAGRAAAGTTISQENERLAVLRQVSRTKGMPQALNEDNYDELESIILPLAASNTQADSFIVLDDQAAEVFRLNRSMNGDKSLEDPVQKSGANFDDWPAVNRALAGDFDQLGDKVTILAKDPEQDITLMYTVGPVWLDDQVIGVILIGNYLQHILEETKLNAQADITLYQSDGSVIGTTFAPGNEEAKTALRISPALYKETIQDPEITPKRQVAILEQNYDLAFAPFKLRGEPIAASSVGLVSDFVVSTSLASRNIFVAAVFFAIVALLIIGFIVTQQILSPIAKLVSATTAIAAGDLNRRTNVASGDEIGRLATSFDHMTVELKQRTVELEEETSKVRAILSSIADGVVVQDKQGRIIEENPAAKEILDSIQDTSLQEASPGTTANSDQSRSDGAMTFLYEIGFDEPKRFALGDRSLSALAAPVVAQDEQTLGSVVVLRDITLEVESEQLKNKFIESVSHELLTPLVPIKGYMDLLLMTSADKLDERQLSFIRKSNQNLNDLHNMISTLIDVTQIESGALGLDREKFDFVELVEETVEYWKPIMADREMTFNAHIQAADLPVDGDIKRLRRVLNYLLDNASLYNRPNGTVDIYVKQENNSVRVDVVDTGVGIAEESQKRIFTRFMRALHEDFFEVRGAGLGLYMSKAIIVQHGGDISFESEANQGSTFNFAIPLAEADDEE